MEHTHTTDTLHTGLLTLDRKFLISPNQDWPELFTSTLERDRVGSIESQARLALGAHGIYASTDRILYPTPETPHKGYLLRESSRVDIESYGFTTYDQEDITSYANDRSEEDIRVHFLRQIARYMKPLN